jgi:hypothetical protein
MRRRGRRIQCHDGTAPGPELYSTGLSPDEGLWHRAGWAGRT